MCVSFLGGNNSLKDAHIWSLVKGGPMEPIPSWAKAETHVEINWSLFAWVLAATAVFPPFSSATTRLYFSPARLPSQLHNLWVEEMICMQFFLHLCFPRIFCYPLLRVRVRSVCVWLCFRYVALKTIDGQQGPSILSIWSKLDSIWSKTFSYFYSLTVFRLSARKSFSEKLPFGIVSP